jgi:hypothetical protein
VHLQAEVVAAAAVLCVQVELEHPAAFLLGRCHCGNVPHLEQLLNTLLIDAILVLSLEGERCSKLIPKYPYSSSLQIFSNS